MCFLLRQQTEMDDDSIKKRKEPQNGSTGHSAVSQNKDEKPVKAAVLQKDVSVCVCFPENKSLEMFTQQDPTICTWGWDSVPGSTTTTISAH